MFREKKKNSISKVTGFNQSTKLTPQSTQSLQWFKNQSIKINMI